MIIQCTKATAESDEEKQIKRKRNEKNQEKPNILKDLTSSHGKLNVV
jgi:hypothetical protein